MKKIRIGLIGLGFMGSTHFRIYKDMPNAEIVALADVEAPKRNGDISIVIGNIGASDNRKPLDLSGIKVYESAPDLIRDENVDAIDICCPTECHAQYIIAGLEAGKHVFSEKPLCRNLEEAEKIAAALAKAKTFFNVGMCVRAWPEYAATYELLKSGSLGKVISATFRRLSPNIDRQHWQNWFMDGKRSGGALLDMHLHDTDIVRHFLGRPRGVTSIGTPILSINNGVDHVITFYHYDDGSVVEAEGCWGAPKTTPFEMSFQIICEKATVRHMWEGFKIYWNDGRVETPEVEKTTGWHVELRYFVDCLAKGVAPDKYQTFSEILDSFRIDVAEQKSVDSGKRVEIEY